MSDRRVVVSGGSATELGAEVDARLAAADRQRALITDGSDRPHGTLAALNEMATQLATASAACGLLSQVHSDPSARTAAESSLRDIRRFIASTQQRGDLYQSLSSLDDQALSRLERRVLSLQLRDMRRSGVLLGDAERERVRAIRAELVTLEQDFARNIRDDVRGIDVAGASLDGLPSDYLESHRADAKGMVRITTEPADFAPFMAYATSDAARRALMLAYATRAAPANLRVLREMLARRHELAVALGYTSYAAYAAEDKLLDSPAAAREFIAQAEEASRDTSERERLRLLEVKKANGLDGSRIEDYELSFLAERVKAAQFSYDGRAVRDYLPYVRVRDGLLELIGDLFGLTFERVDMPLWAPAVETFQVRIDGKVGGLISLDMFPRAGKFKHAACFPYRPGVAGKQQPHFVLVCNFPQAQPALLEHRDLVTFIHELGHVIHGVLGGSGDWLELAEPSEDDFMEVPSKLLEEWAFSEDVLARFGRHHESGDPIPQSLVSRLRAARDFGSALQVRRQLFLAALSLALHDRDPSGLDPTQLCFELAEVHSPTHLSRRSSPLASLAHLVTYGPMYVSYVSCLVLAKDLFSAFDGPMDRRTARRFRDQVLAPGGTKPAAELLRDFLGRPVSFEPFRTWLSPEVS